MRLSAFSRARAYALLFLLAGALARIAGLFHPPPLDIDEVRYLVTAHHAAAGIGYSDWRGPETHIHPAHPLLTAALAGKRIEGLEVSGRIITCFGAIACLIPLGLLACRLGGEAASPLALALLAIHPVLARQASAVAPEGLYVLFAAMGLLTLLPRAGVAPSAWRWALAGAFFGGAYLARSEGLLVGILAGSLAAACAAGGFRRRAGGLLLFLFALLCVASPFLIFVHRVTGSWTLTGKTLELFFIGQALRETGGVPPDYLRLRALEAQWGGVMPYLLAHPREVLLGALLNARAIFARILPALLGVPGLLGILAWLAAVWRDRDRRRASLLLLSPCLTLILMLLTFPNQRVVSSVLPFLLILAAVGWSWLLRTFLQAPQARIVALLALLAVAGIGGWGRSLGRLRAGDFVSPLPERVAADKALSEANPARIACNDPVLSFYAGEPALFGPPGRYAPLPSKQACPELVEHLTQRQASVAILSEFGAGLDAEELDAVSGSCPLREIFRTKRSQGRTLQVLALESPGGVR